MNTEETKIKVDEFSIADPKTYIIRTSDEIPPIKLYRLKLAIEDYINRPLYEITDSCVEFDIGGSKVMITKEDLMLTFKTLFPEFFPSQQNQ